MTEFFLEAAAAEIEAHVGRSGWDCRPTLFALVRAAQFAVDEPDTAARLGIDASADGGRALTPIEQDELPEGELDLALAQIAWPDSVAGCALSQEIVILPPEAQAQLPDDGSAVPLAAAHPDRREARLVVAVLRDGSSAAVLRLRATAGSNDELVTGPDLAPNLVAALFATFAG